MSDRTDRARLAAVAWGSPLARACAAELGAGAMLAAMAGPPPVPALRRAWPVWAATVRSLRHGPELSGFLVPGDASWPRRLDALGPDAPLGLWVRGEPDSLSPRSSLAVVGARAATSYGERMTERLIAPLADAGTLTVSGAAYGIDAAAHRAALRAGAATVAVLAGGADRPSPAGHAELLERIAERGAIVSEAPPGATPRRSSFLDRNRLIAALGDATLVVEAGRRSGALNTAGHAAAAGRPLGAVPGPATSAASAGCHRLLREYGAVCVTSAEEVAELIGMQLDAATSTAAPGHQEALAVLRASGPLSAAELADRLDGGLRQAVGALGALELAGLARADGGMWAAD